ncbi:AAA family ATPase [Chryseolinea sp. T2]|uniref:helix-turn-helix transcriptional regulator n=1 Tax=Chryseolinea sp. T2 TaxID=3129255 RepID=UPI0030775C68
MILIERENYLKTLQDRFAEVSSAGHTVFLMGEAGIGKTSLVTHFRESLGIRAHTYIGGCDSLFTPHPLGPLHDIAPQLDSDFATLLRTEKERSVIFTSFFESLSASKRPVLLVIEDVHWADEATIDLIKFISRRISKLRCLFVLTMRDNELDARHALKILFGQLPADTFTKVHVSPLSRKAVEEMAVSKGHSTGEKVFALTGGNPFYVTEVLATGMAPIPERIKDSVLTAFHSKDEHTQELWELLSVLPSRIEPSIVSKIEHEYPNVIENCLASGVIVNRNDTLSFKHELYRIAIEESISKYRRKHLHKRVLALLDDSTGATLAQRVHHARFAEDHRLVVELAPKAAKEAAALGAHLEAAKLYKTAIEHAPADYQGMPELYARYAYECYLINQISNALTAQEQCLAFYRKGGNLLRIGDTLRFLSRLQWFGGNRGRANTYANESVQVLEQLPPSKELALAYSNFAQLNMLSDNKPQTLHWGEKAIALAEQLNDAEILCHALNNVGSILLKSAGNEEEGASKLQQSLSIALTNGFHEHAARAYTNMGCFYVLMKRYDRATKWLDEGLKYCEELDLLSWYYYMQGERTRLLLDTGAWAEAERISLSLQLNADHFALTRIGALVTLARFNIRRGNFDDAQHYLDIAKQLAAPTAEAYRMLPVMAAQLELCWTTGKSVPVEELNAAIALLPDIHESWHYAGVAYWMLRCSIPVADHSEVRYPGPFAKEQQGQFEAAAQEWKSAGCAFEQALALIECGEEQQRAALAILDNLGATATSEMLKTKLREKGMRHIPRGPRESTKSNPAHLTGRQVEILALLDLGAQNKEIAEKLFISPKTVDHHISAILSKLSVNSRTKAVAEARRLGILK